MIIKRAISTEFLRRQSQYPIVTVVGPRQSGKTTLVKQLCPKHPYVNLEKPDTRAFATDDPNRFLAQYPEGAILDEVQNVPSLLSYLQVIVDEKKQMGQYILTGSHQLALHDALAQSLAGRTTILQLLPLSFDELKNENSHFSVNDYLLNGFYPRIYQDQSDYNAMYSDYVKTYLERDVRQITHVKDLMSFQKFMRLCASRTATVLNMSDIAKDVGVSHNTIREWISILQASYLVELIPPYFENFGKRIIKSPKLYFTDVGLASYLLGIETPTQMDRDPLRGRLYETMVVMELIKTRFNKGRDANMYFYRDSEKKEIDVLYKHGSLLSAVEIKSSQTLSSDFTKGIQYLKNVVGNRFSQAYVVYSGKDEMIYHDVNILNHLHASRIIAECDRN